MKIGVQVNTSGLYWLYSNCCCVHSAKPKTSKPHVPVFLNSYLIFSFKGATKLYFMQHSCWSLFCSVWVYISLHFLPILLIKLVFCLSMFWLFMFLLLLLLVFIFAVLCFEFNVIPKDLITFFHFILTLFKRSVKI